MKVIVAIFAVIVAVEGSWDPGLRVRFGIGLFPGSTFLYDMPRSVSKAVSDGMVIKERNENAPMPSLVMYCYEDNVICLYFDDNGDVAGLQISIYQDKFLEAIYSWEVLGFTEWTTTVNGTTKNLWAKDLFFVSDETLAKSKEERLAARAVSNVTLQEDFLIMSGFNNELVKINRNASDVTSSDSIFTKQGCFLWMGNHYYYNMSSTTVCSETTLFSWFPLVYSNELVGIGFYVPGQLPTSSDEKVWCEDPDESTVRMIIPYGPECMYQIAKSPGVVTMHIYFIDKPWLITCIVE